MTSVECVRGRQVVTAIVAGQWNEEQNAQVRAHAETCASCAELAVLAGLFSEERESLGHDVSLPLAGQVWWRSAIRGRLEDQRAAARPLVWLYAAAAAVGISLTAAVVRVAAPALGDAAGRFAAATDELAVWRVMTSLSEAAPPAMPLVLGVGAALVVLLLPLLYVALSDD